MADTLKCKGTLKICTSVGDVYDCVQEEAGLGMTLNFSFPRTLGVTGGRLDVFFCGGCVGESFELSFCGTDMISDTFSATLSRGVCDLGSAVSVRAYVDCAYGEYGVRRTPSGELELCAYAEGECDAIVIPPPDAQRQGSLTMLGVVAECEDVATCDAVTLTEREVRLLCVPRDIPAEIFHAVCTALLPRSIECVRDDIFYDTRAVNVHLEEALCDYLEGRGTFMLEGELKLLEQLCPDEAAFSLLNPIKQNSLDTPASAMLTLCMYMLPGVPLVPAGNMSDTPELYTMCVRLGKVYRRIDVLREGYFNLSHLDGNILIFTRYREGETVVCVVNRSECAYTVSCRAGMSVIFGGRGYKTSQRIPPRSSAVFAVEKWRGEEKYLSVTRE